MSELMSDLQIFRLDSLTCLCYNCSRIKISAKFISKFALDDKANVMKDGGSNPDSQESWGEYLTAD